MSCSRPSGDLRSLPLLLCLLGLLGLNGGCAARPYAAAEMHLGEHEPRQTSVLDDRDRAEIRAAFATLIAEHEPVSPPAQAVHGVRWADVQLAAYYAAMDVEMAIVRTRRSDGELRFSLRSSSERPGELIVRRVDDERVYVAAATIGMFHDDEAAAQRLLEAFDRRMRGLGAKRAFDE